MEAPFEYDLTLFCRAYERASGWAAMSSADRDGKYYWRKFKAELCEMYWSFDRSRAIRAGKIYPHSRKKVASELRLYMRRNSKKRTPIRVLRVRYGDDNFGYETHDLNAQFVVYYSVREGLPEELQGQLAVLLIADAGTDMPGIGYRAAQNIFYLER